MTFIAGPMASASGKLLTSLTLPFSSFYSSAGLSTKAGAKMTGEPHFTYFVDYYGSDDYAHRWVEAAFAGSAIGFDNGDADFSLYGILGRLQGIKKGTACMRMLMYAIHETKSTVGKCEAGSTDRNAAALHAWDRVG